MTSDLRAKLERGLGLFDLDGTLIAWDTQILFCDFVLKREPMRRAFLAFFAAFLPAAGVLGDEGLKRVFLSYLWRTNREQLAAWVREFIAEWIPSRCYAEMLERVTGHRDAGHLTVLASASPDFYAVEIGRALGFDLALATQVDLADPVQLLPDLINHKGSEKVRRLSEIIGAPENGGKWPNSHGYSDSSADLPMLECCEEATLVNPSASMTALAGERGWEIVTPALPWRSKTGKVLETLRRITGNGSSC